MALTDDEKEDRRVARHLTAAAGEYMAIDYRSKARELAQEAATIRRGYKPYYRAIDRALAFAEEGAAARDADASYRAACAAVAKHLRAALRR